MHGMRRGVLLLCPVMIPVLNFAQSALFFTRGFAICMAGAVAAGCGVRGGDGLGASGAQRCRGDVSAPAADGSHAHPPRDVRVPGTNFTLRMIHVPGGDGPGFRLSAMEISWELYEHFLYELDDPSALSDDPELAARQAQAHAVTRPSRPYISMDRGFGRINYPAISMSLLGAETFCQWLSALTGERFRLPTKSEWQHACALGGIAPESLEDHAWIAGNSGLTTHPRGSRSADALGLFDMIGNAAEWVIIPAAEGDETWSVRGAVMGGSYLTDRAEAGCDCVQMQTPDWNASDPQFPKSAWWLADAGFVGFRVLMEVNSNEKGRSK